MEAPCNPGDTINPCPRRHPLSYGNYIRSEPSDWKGRARPARLQERKPGHCYYFSFLAGAPKAGIASPAGFGQTLKIARDEQACEAPCLTSIESSGTSGLFTMGMR